MGYWGEFGTGIGGLTGLVAGSVGYAYGLKTIASYYDPQMSCSFSSNECLAGGLVWMTAMLSLPFITMLSGGVGMAVGGTVARGITGGIEYIIDKVRK